MEKPDQDLECHFRYPDAVPLQNLKPTHCLESDLS